MFIDPGPGLIASLEVGVPAAVAAVVPGDVHPMVSPQSEHDSELEYWEQQRKQEAANTQLEILPENHGQSDLVTGL